MSKPVPDDTLPEDAYAGEFAESVLPPPTPEPPAAHPVRGVMLLVSALFFFACMDTTTKYLAAEYPVPLVMAVRYFVNGALMVVLLAPRQGMQLLETQRTGLVVLRGLCLVMASLCVGLALQRIPVAETTSLIFLGPMLVVLIARPVLGETIGIFGWIAATAGLGGVLLIVRPGSGLDTVGVLFGLGAACANAAYQLLSRILISTERTIALLFYTALVGSICFGASLPWFWAGATPTRLQVLLFLSVGAAGGMGHFLFTAAFRHAPASMLAPINYLQLLWSGLLGWIVFGHVPDGPTVIGMGIIAASGVLITFKSRRAKAG